MSLAAEAITIYPAISKLEQSTPSPPSSTPPVLSPSPLSLCYSLCSTELTDYLDRSAYSSTSLPFVEEFAHLAALTSLVHSASSHISTVYTFRSVSKAIPLVQQDTPEQAKQELHITTFAILRPEVLKMKELMDFTATAVKQLHSTLAFMQRMEAERRVPSEPLYQGSVELLDLLLLLDALKDMKTCLLNDFARYKRAFQPIKASLTDSGALSDEIPLLQMFLSEHNAVYSQLRAEVQRLPSHDLVLLPLLAFCCEQLERKRYIDSEEYHRLHRVLPHLLYLLDQADDPMAKKGATGVNVFRYAGKGRLDLERVRRYVRLLPIIPLYMDMHLDVLFVLKRLPHFEEDKMRSDWISLPADTSVTSPTSPAHSRRDKLYQRYHLIYQRQRIRSEYQDYCVAFSEQRHLIEQMTGMNATLNMQLLHSFFYTLLTGLRLLAGWRAKVQEQCAWKYAFTCPLPLYAAQGGKGGEGHEYEKAVRYNYSSEDLYALVDVLSMIKGLGALLLSHQLLIEMVVRRTIHDDMQTFLQAEVGESTRKAHKHKRLAVKELMLAMRDIAGDWLNPGKKAEWERKSEAAAQSGSAGGVQHDNINFLQDANLLVVNKDYPLRAVTASPMQIAFMRRMMHSIYSDKSVGMQGGMFSEKDLKKESQVVWSEYYDLSFFYPHLLQLSQHVQQAMDLSFLWYREFYLELTKCIQFPISMSLPWILTDYLISTSNSLSTKACIFYTMDLYNDAAHVALTSLHQQYLYDEVQAELHVSFEQLVFHLSEAIFKYHLILANERLLKKGYAKRWYDSAGGAGAGKREKYAVKENRFVALMQQSNLSLLGRSIDLSLFITRRLNLKLREYLELALRKFEAAPLTEVVEFQHLLDVAHTMHQLLSEQLQLDAWETMLKEVNEDTVVGQFRNRILFHVLSELLSDLIPNFVYNAVTGRFVRAAQTFAPAAADRSRPPSQPPSYFFSHKHNVLYSALFSSFRAYFGSEHLLALISLLRPLQSYPLMLSELTGELHSKLFNEFYPYSLALLTGLPLFKLPTIQYTILGVYGYLDVKLRTSLGVYAPLRPSVFHVLREVGNVMWLLRGLEEADEVWSLTPFLFTAHFQSIKARSKQERAEAAKRGEGGLAVRSSGVGVPSYVNAIKESAPFFQQHHAPAELFSTLTGLSEQASRMYAQQDAEQPDGPTSAFAQSMQRIIQALGTIESVWVHPLAATGAPPDSSTKNDLVRLLSCLLFIFTQPPDYNPAPLSAASADVIGRDAALFGDGMLLAITFLLHALGLKRRFLCEDYSAYVVGLECMYPIDRDKFAVGKKGKGVGWSETEKQELQLLDFVRNTRLVREKMKGLFGWLERFAPVEEAGLRRSKGSKGGGGGGVGRGWGRSGDVQVLPPDSEGDVNKPVRVVPL